MTNPLHDAVLREDIDEVKLLIKNKVDQHITNHNSQTAIMLAAATPNLEILQFLIDSEPELTRQTLFDKQDINGNDLLQYAIAFLHIDNIRLILRIHENF